uniref:Uncharacterized protein n=1 Tax=Cucumis melo TaxID=3656 RepID=A0A9I9E8P6_CUCME
MFGYRVVGWKTVEKKLHVPTEDQRQRKAVNADQYSSDSSADVKPPTPNSSLSILSWTRSHRRPILLRTRSRRCPILPRMPSCRRPTSLLILPSHIPAECSDCSADAKPSLPPTVDQPSVPPTPDQHNPSLRIQ